jgi:hypothetical protein
MLITPPTWWRRQVNQQISQAGDRSRRREAEHKAQLLAETAARLSEKPLLRQRLSTVEGGPMPSMAPAVSARADRIIDEELLMAGRSARGGWNRAQLEIIGIAWPPRAGWKKRLLAEEVPISESDATAFVNRRGSPRGRRRGRARR